MKRKPSRFVTACAIGGLCWMTLLSGLLVLYLRLSADLPELRGVAVPVLVGVFALIGAFQGWALIAQCAQSFTPRVRDQAGPVVRDYALIDAGILIVLAGAQGAGLLTSRSLLAILAPFAALWAAVGALMAFSLGGALRRAGALNGTQVLPLALTWSLIHAIGVYAVTLVFLGGFGLIGGLCGWTLRRAIERSKEKRMLYDDGT